LPPSGVCAGKSPGTDDGKGVGRGAIGVTAGLGCVIGRGAADDAGLARGGSVDFAGRLAFALRAGLRFAAAFFFRIGARFAARLTTRFFAFAFFALRCTLRILAMAASDL
jgi:hypothetical protein